MLTGPCQEFGSKPKLLHVKRSCGSTFLPNEPFFQLRLLPKGFQAGSSSESGHQATVQKAGDAGQLEEACRGLSHLAVMG